MNKIKSPVLFGTFASPVLGCSTEELKIPPASASRERTESCIPSEDLSLDPLPHLTSICNHVLSNYGNARRPTGTEV